MASDTGLRLEIPGEVPPTTGLAKVNKALAAFGARVWPLDLSGATADIRQLLAQPTLTEAESKRIMDKYLLSRERLLEIIEGAGREPQVPGGGEMTTYVTSHDYSYPQLYLVEDGIDYSRFDRFHVNTTEVGTGVDEVMHILSGRGVTFLQRQPNGSELTLQLDCLDENSGWIITYSGEYPHIGSISGATPGAKILMQVIGPPRWAIRYIDEG